jgi:hypothetical protein
MKLIIRLKRNIFLLMAIIGITSISHAATIKGSVTNNETQFPLNGAVISLKNTAHSVIANSSGQYIIENVKRGNYILQVTYPNYISVEKEIVISSRDEVLTIDFPLHPVTKEMSEIEVIGTIKTDKESDLDAR